MQRARLALNSDRPQDAQRIADEILKLDPDQPQALQVRGCALLMQKRAADAVAPLQAAARDLRDGETDTLLAMALRQSGRMDEALARLKRATKRRPLRLRRALEMLGSHRGDYAVVHPNNHVNLSQSTNDVYPTAVKLALHSAIDEVRSAMRELANAFVRALEIAPQSADALFGIAKASQSVGETASAADFYRRCLLFTPDDAACWLNLGQCFLQLGQIEAGYDCFRTAARGDPKRYGKALTSFAASGHGRLWLKPSAAARFFAPRH